MTAIGGNQRLRDAPDLDESGKTAGQVIVVAGDGVTYELDDAAGGVTDHGALTGLVDDDHTQYHTNARGDARYQPLDSDLTAIAALTTTAYGRALLSLANQAALLAAAGAAAASHAHAGEDVTSGTIADARIASTIARDTEVTNAVAAEVIARDAAIAAAIAALVASAPGVLDTLDEIASALGDDPNFATTITTALAGKQPLDSDLTAVAALTTTAFGRSLLTLADAAALLAAAGAAAAAHAHSGADITSGTIAEARIHADIARDSEVAAGYQPLDADLTAIAALTTTAAGRALLALVDPNADRILFWDDSAGAFAHLQLGTNLSITGTTLDAAGGGGSGEAVRRTVSQTAHGFAVGDVMRLDGTDTYAKAQADSAANAEVVGIIVDVPDANSFVLHMSGYIDAELSGLTAETTYFLSPSSAGDLTATPPTDPGDVSKPVLVASDTDSGYFVNWRGIVNGSMGGTEAALDWQDVATGVGFNSDWANFGAPYGSVQYAKDDAKQLLYFRGVANPGTPTLAFTLPVGYRPSAQRIVQAFGDGGVVPREVKTNGEVDFYSGPGSSASFDNMVVSL